MLRQRTRTLQAAAALTDAVATAMAFFGAYYLAGPFLERVARASERLPDLKVVLPLSRYLWVLWVSVPMWWVLFAFFGCYDFSPLERRRESLWRMARPTAMGAMAIAGAIFFSKELLFARRVIGGFVLANIVLLAAGRLLVLTVAGRLHRAGAPLRRMLIIGTGRAAIDFGEKIRQAGWGLKLAGYVAQSGHAEEVGDECLGTIEALAQVLDEHAIDDVVLADPTGDLSAVQQAIHACEEVGVSIHIPSRFFDAALSRPHVQTFSGIPMLTFSTRPYNPVALGIKRAADLIVTLLLAPIFAVPMLVIAALIKLTSPGPVIFKQERCGLYGRRFVMCKFRTMVAGAEAQREALEAVNEMDGPVFKMRDDPRVTAVGQRLRRYSLDELPQLWNVLKGDMSLIGPRPPLPAEVEKYERWQRRRLSMRPGLTCIWQVTDRNLATFEKWMECDLRYIDNWSLWLDLKIALRTIPAVLRGTGL